MTCLYMIIFLPIYKIRSIQGQNIPSNTQDSIQEHSDDLQQMSLDEQGENRQISDTKVDLILPRRRVRSINPNIKPQVGGSDGDSDCDFDCDFDDDFDNTDENFEDYSCPSFKSQIANNDQFLWILCNQGSSFGSFPDSLFSARNILGLQDRFHKFAACPKCHKLYTREREPLLSPERKILTLYICYLSIT